MSNCDAEFAVPSAIPADALEQNGAYLGNLGGRSGRTGAFGETSVGRGSRRSAPDIQEALLFLPRMTEGRDSITERDIRAIVAVPDWWKQWRMWATLKNGIMK